MLNIIRSLLGLRKRRDFDPEEFRRMEKAMYVAGQVRGRHYTEWVEKVKQLKRNKKYQEAILLLTEIVAAVERESDVGGKEYGGVAPGYYEDLAIIYRREKQYDNEVAILEKYQAQCDKIGSPYSSLGSRLPKAKEIRDKATRQRANKSTKTGEQGVDHKPDHGAS